MCASFWAATVIASARLMIVAAAAAANLTLILISPPKCNLQNPWSELDLMLCGCGVYHFGRSVYQQCTIKRHWI